VKADIWVHGFADVEVDADSLEEAKQKFKDIVNIEDITGDPVLTELDSMEFDDEEIEQLD
jgi:hypothetical protein